MIHFLIHGQDRGEISVTLRGLTSCDLGMEVQIRTGTWHGASSSARNIANGIDDMIILIKSLRFWLCTVGLVAILGCWMDSIGFFTSIWWRTSWFCFWASQFDGGLCFDVTSPLPELSTFDPSDRTSLAHFGIERTPRSVVLAPKVAGNAITSVPLWTPMFKYLHILAFYLICIMACYWSRRWMQAPDKR